jgi:hypothetical protein
MANHMTRLSSMHMTRILPVAPGLGHLVLAKVGLTSLHMVLAGVSLTRGHVVTWKPPPHMILWEVSLTRSHMV